MAGTMAEKWRKNGKVGAADRRSTNDSLLPRQTMICGRGFQRL